LHSYFPVCASNARLLERYGSNKSFFNPICAAKQKTDVGRSFAWTYYRRVGGTLYMTPGKYLRPYRFVCHRQHAQRASGLSMTTPPCRSHRLPLGLALAMALTAAAPLRAATPNPQAASPAPGDAGRPAVSQAASSYSLGLSFATQWREGGLDGLLSEPDLIRGIHAGLAGSPLTADDRQKAGSFLHEAYESWATRNKAAASAFLAHNATQPGVKTTASGLQYVVMSAGEAGSPMPAAGDHVTVQYRGRLLDGKEFDSSYSRGKPAVIRPGDVIAGWREALAMMHRGAQWRVFVPPDLAYAMTPPPSIPPNSLLVFDIEIVGVESADSARAPVPAAALH
jgi:FKBP-type peptidyl-prolyl cis-trans isomerase